MSQSEQGWIPTEREHWKDVQDRSRSFMVSAVLPTANDLQRCTRTAGCNISVCAPCECQPDLHHLVTEAIKLGAPCVSDHIKTMAYLTETNRAKFLCQGKADILLVLPTPVNEVDIIASIGSRARENGYGTFPPQRFATAPSCDVAGLRDVERGDRTDCAMGSVAFGDLPRAKPIRCIVGEFAALAECWTVKLGHIIRDMEYMGFGEGILPVLVLRGMGADWSKATEEMATFFAAVPDNLKYLGYLKKHLVVLHDGAPSHPSNAQAALNLRLEELADSMHSLMLARREHKALLEAAAQREAREAEISIDSSVDALKAASEAKINALEAEIASQMRKLQTIPDAQTARDES
jgi:hypothetical protein